MKSEKAAQQLFLWAILFNRIDLALLLWNHASDHIGNSNTSRQELIVSFSETCVI